MSPSVFFRLSFIQSVTFFKAREYLFKTGSAKKDLYQATSNFDEVLLVSNFNFRYQFPSLPRFVILFCIYCNASVLVMPLNMDFVITETVRCYGLLLQYFRFIVNLTS